MTDPDPSALRRVRALATDYDRTLTTPNLDLEQETVDVLHEAREMGLKVIVISGRDLAFLKNALEGSVDAFVAENGCFVAMPESQEAVPTFDEAFEAREELERAGIDVEWWEAMGSCGIDDAKRVREILEGHAVDFIPNRDTLMILPRGVNKAVGLEAAAHALGLHASEVAAAGDGENDVHMLELAGYGLVVSNGLDSVKQLADHVTDEPGGRGVSAWVRHWMAANRDGAAAREEAPPAGSRRS